MSLFCSHRQLGPAALRRQTLALPLPEDVDTVLRGWTGSHIRECSFWREGGKGRVPTSNPTGSGPGSPWCVGSKWTAKLFFL